MSAFEDMLRQSGEDAVLKTLSQGPRESLTGVPARLYGDSDIKVIPKVLDSRVTVLDGVRAIEDRMEFNYYRPGRMNFEDDFTEIDPSAKLSQSSYRSSWTSLSSTLSDTLLYEDLEMGYFGDFTNTFTLYVTSFDDPATDRFLLFPVSYASSLKDYSYNKTNGHLQLSIGVWAANGVATYTLTLAEIDGKASNDVNDIVSGLTVATVYYVKVVKSGSTITVTVYSDETLETSLGSYTGTLQNGDIRYRYLFAPQSSDLVANDFNSTGYVEDFRLSLQVKDQDKFVYQSDTWIVDSNPQVRYLDDRLHHCIASTVREVKA